VPSFRNLLYYIVTIGLCGTDVLDRAARRPLESSHALAPVQVNGYWQQFKDTYQQNLTHPLAILLLQILAIIVVARAFGFVFQKIGLPSVVGRSRRASSWGLVHGAAMAEYSGSCSLPARWATCSSSA
jgi:hypothetical protein